MFCHRNWLVFQWLFGWRCRCLQILPSVMHSFISIVDKTSFVSLRQLIDFSALSNSYMKGQWSIWGLLSIWFYFEYLFMYDEEVRSFIFPNFWEYTRQINILKWYVSHIQGRNCTKRSKIWQKMTIFIEIKLVSPMCFIHQEIWFNCCYLSWL